MVRRPSLTAFAALFTTLALASAGCDPDDLGGGPPGGQGGWDAAGGWSHAGNGTGTGTGGGGTTTDPDHPVCDDSYKLCARELTYADQGESTVELRGDWGGAGTWQVGAPMAKDGGVWRVTIDAPWDQTFQYKFVLNGATWVPDPANPEKVDDNNGGYNSVAPAVTCDTWKCGTSPGGDDPKLDDWRDEVMYFVFVDRFFDGNPANNGGATPGVEPPADWKGGDWAGVKQKIQDGYFTDLGVTLLWLTVPMDNTSQAGKGTGGDDHNYTGYHGYWPSNLDKPEEHFGTLAELKDVVDTAHAAGIKVILDYAMNHVHASSPAYQQHPEWFWKLSDCGVCGSPQCPWDGPSGKKCWFTDYLPDFNFTSDAARSFSVQNAVWWVQQTGVDGFRLDAVKHIENSWMWDLRDALSTQVESVTGKHFYTVGETFSYSQNDILKDPVTGNLFVDPAKALTGQFDFPIRLQVTEKVLRREGSMADLDGFLDGNDGYYGAGVMSTFIGNHDLPRVIHQAEDVPKWGVHDNDKNVGWYSPPGLPSGMSAFERLANGFTVLFTTRGIPLIYYGDEVGLPGAADPDNRRFMQWSGYSAGQLYLRDHLKKLGAIRASHPALSKGDRQKLSVSTDTYAYRMSDGSDTVYVALNRSDSAKDIPGLPTGTLQDLLTGATVNGGTVNVPARKAMILVQP